MDPGVHFNPVKRKDKGKERKQKAVETKNEQKRYFRSKHWK